MGRVLKWITLRRAMIVVAVTLLGWLLWPLSTKAWAIDEASDNGDEKARYLEAERALSRRPAPRVIVIVADDLARMDVALYGGANGAAPVPTPAIDSIGHDGAVFNQASATATICAPSRAALLTGRYPQRFGFELQPHDQYARNRLEYLAFRYAIDTDPMRPVSGYGIPRRRELAEQGLPASEVTLAELLRARGYSTAAIGKWHLGYDLEFSPLERGFDQHFGFYEAFTLYAPIGTPGIVDTPIDDFSDKHMWSREREGASAIVRNDVVVEESEYLTFRFADLAAEYITDHAEEPFFLYLPFNAPHTPLQAPESYVRELDHIADPVRRTYAAMIAALDDAVGQVLQAVDDAGITEETLIVFTSDNGGTSYLGVTDNGPLAGGKFTNFEGGIAVPLMIRYPGQIDAGTVVNDPVSLLDIFATVDAATRPDDAPERPPGMQLDGMDLIGFMNGSQDARPHDELYWRWFYNKAVRSGEWKLMVTEDGSPAVPAGERQVELYNLRLDPGEHNNVADDHPLVVAELLCRLSAWESGLAGPLWPPVMHFRQEIWGRERWFAI
jgi:arylsulfatase A-like enzyme